MARSRKFSIYLLKEGYSADNSLVDDHGLGAPTPADHIPEGATLYLAPQPPRPPWWKEYWGIDKELNQSLQGAIVFLPVEERCFAITFGHTYHKLKDECYEYDFGLRTTLNTLDPDEIKSTDILQPESSRRQRIQSPTAANLTFFDIDRNASIFKKLTGKVKDEFKDRFTNTTGASNLSFGSKASPNELLELCEELLEIYLKDDFTVTFPDIQNISPVKDPTVLHRLNEELLTAYENQTVHLVMTIPEIIDHDTDYSISYSGRGKRSESYEDVYITHYREYVDTLVHDVESLKTHKLHIDYEHGHHKQYTVYKCLLFDCELDGDSYHLTEGNWYKIDQNYMAKIKTEVDPYFREHDILTTCDIKREDNFNKSIAKSNDGYICLDGKSISPKGQKQVEPCDLCVLEDGSANLIHIKISTRSASLSHLLNQGLNSVELLRGESESMRKMLKLVGKDTDLKSAIENGEYKVTYGIITSKDKDMKSEALPIFSRISLYRALKALQVMGVAASVVLIEDQVDRKTKKQKKSKAA